MTGEPDAGHALRRAAAVGPFFATVEGPLPDGFRPLAELAAPEFWRRRIAEVGERLGTDEPRVAASVAQLGVAARLWSVALGTAVLGGVVPDYDRSYWRLPPGGSLELWVPGVLLPDGPLAAALHRTVVERQLAPLAAGIRAVTPVAEGLLWGNAASALAGAVRVLRSGGGPAAELLDRPPLRGALTSAGRRTSCCLYYRVPGAGLCGDCVFDRPPRAR
ncbi:(2Fe-2S)-binding protein [Kitasatospora sp. NPDC101801]|uniref:(2Fe-2S)-binding protein n=1 Tax=Kitasatospora sp. NPDC101801 TaxID=3364103 RepID=UPI00382EB6DD